MRKFKTPFVLLLAVFSLSFGYFTASAQTGFNNLKEEVIDPNEEPLGIETSELSFDDLKIYSHNGELKINFSNDVNGKIKYEVYNLIGNQLISEEEQKTGTEMKFRTQISNLPKSVYIVRLSQGNHMVSRKVQL